MDTLALPLLAYYAGIVLVFCVYGMHRYRQIAIFVRHGGLRRSPEPEHRFTVLPTVTVQLPMFNERRVAERVIAAACRLDYPRDRIQIQVLDDSTDESVGIVRRACRRWAAAGHDVVHLHRTNRAGFKAGALADGLKTARGELVALFDADFIPPPDFIRRMIDHFTDPKVGMVQARWSHVNRDESMLTQIQALRLYAHFVVEQTARARAGCWFNFNGTAGMWRRRCIDDAGGWQHDTLTEDTDLSYRAQLAGWTFRYLPQVTCPAEIPPTVGALMTQQHRWSKGLVQSAIKLLPSILASRAPLATKLEAFFHLTSPLPYAAMLLLTLIALPSLFVGLPSTGIPPAIALGVGMLCLALGTFSACGFSVAAQAAQGRPIAAAILRLPALMALGIGLSLVNTRAMLEAVGGRKSSFVRTPKFNGEAESEFDPAVRRRRLLPRGTPEILLGAVMVACVGFSVIEPTTLVGLPFLLMFAAGYLWIGVARVIAELRRPRRSPGACALHATTTDGARTASPRPPAVTTNGACHHREVGPRVS